MVSVKKLQPLSPWVAAGLEGDEGTALGAHLNNTGSNLTNDLELVPPQRLKRRPGGSTTFNDEVKVAARPCALQMERRQDNARHLSHHGTQMHGNGLASAVSMRDGED